MRRNKNRTVGIIRALSALVMALTLCRGAPALAEEPVVSAVGSARLSWQNTSGRDRPINEFLIQGEQELKIEVASGFAALARLKLESLAPSLPGETKALRGAGVYAEELYVQWTGGGARIKAGKFNANFSRGWYLFPTALNTPFAGDYELSEQLGVEAAFGSDFGAGGLHTVTVSLSMADNSFLHQSGPWDRGRIVPDMGGAGNTESPRTFAVAYDGRKLSLGHQTLGWQIGYAQLGRGLGDTGWERDVAASLALKIPVGAVGIEEIKVTFEAAKRWDTNGVAGETTDYATAGVEARMGVWSAALLHSERAWQRINAPSSRDRSTEIALTRTLGGGFSVTAAYGHDIISGRENHMVALQLVYGFTRCEGCQQHLGGRRRKK